ITRSFGASLGARDLRRFRPSHPGTSSMTRTGVSEQSSWRRGLTACGEGDDLPIAARFIVPKDVDVPIVGVDLEPSLRGSGPAVDDGADLEPALTTPERKWLLLGAIASVAFDADRHRAILFGGDWKRDAGLDPIQHD